MIKTHTAQSLGKYLGGNVIDFESRFVYKLTGINTFTHALQVHDGSYELYYDFKNYGTKLFESFIPIVKTYDKVTYEDLLYIYENAGYYYKAFVLKEKVKCDFSSFCADEMVFKPEVMERLIERGFGAIQNTESPTDYVDLFGYVCEVEK